MHIPSLQQTKEIFAIPGEIRYPEVLDNPAGPHATAHSLTPELFGYDIIPGKSRISLPYFERFLTFREQNNDSSMSDFLVAKMFSTTPGAHEGVQEALDAYQTRLNNLLRLYPEQKLTLAQGAMALSLGEDSLQKIFNKRSIALETEMVMYRRGGKRPSPMVSVDQLDSAFTWRYPASYPATLIPPEHQA